MTKDQICKKILKYTVVFEPADDGGFVASVPSLPGCVTQGETYEETVEMVKDAISGYLAILNEEKQEIPTENEESVVTKVSVPFPLNFAV